jgi:asparagine synthase (glutamine-hydrolysing)
MCSITGSNDRGEVERMLSVMKHRGPDGEGIIGDREFSIGMGRLAIIDLKSDNLCLYKKDNYVLSFNGEIYNYIELREELKEHGIEFETTSDTEVLLKSFIFWGIECFNKLNGMFAFAIRWGNKILVARDIAGEKPLYYTLKPFRFASEAKALGYDCEEFPPACYGIYDLDKDVLTVKQYWSFIPKAKDWTEEEALDILENLLIDSVKLRTRSDVPYALYYSGGIDSELLSSMHDFKEKINYDYGEYKEDFFREIKKIVYHMDYPIESFSPFGLWQLAKKTSEKGIKVVLSGEGADELFGGYIRYVPDSLYREARKKFPSYKKMFHYSKDVNEHGWYEFNGNLRELLRMGDRMSSAFGLENRCPFLDKRIIEFAFSLPPELKISGLDTKYLLRKILLRRNPNYQEPEKKGLYVPVNRWIGSKQTYGKTDWVRFQKEVAQGKHV